MYHYLHVLAGPFRRALRVPRPTREEPQSHGLVSGLLGQKTLQKVAGVLSLLPRAEQPPPVLAVPQNAAAGAALAPLGRGTGVE